MWISPALAHGTSVGGTSAGGIVPVILLAVAIVFFLARAGQKSWRGRKLERDSSGM